MSARAVVLALLAAVGVLVAAGYVWQAWTAVRRRLTARAGRTPAADDGIWQDCADDDPVDAHAAQAIALLTPDAAQPGDHADLPAVPPRVVDELVRQIYDHLTPPTPPVMPGRPQPEQGQESSS